MRIKFLLPFFLFSCIFQLTAQDQYFIGTPLKPKQHPALKAQFKQSKIYQLDINGINTYAKSGAIDIDFNLSLGNKFNWDISIYPHDIRTPNYLIRAQTENGIETMPLSENKTFRGSISGNPNSVVALTLDEDFIYGFIRVSDAYYFIEPLWYFVKDAPKNQIVVYAATDVIENDDHVCGAMELEENKEILKNAPKSKGGELNKSITCYEVELAIASDDAMFDSYGTVTAVENHNIAVNNNVNTDYDNSFTHEIQFNIIEQFVVTTGTNPWGFTTGSPNAGDLLSAFRTWGNGGGFTNDFDLASLWTNLDLAGSTIGVAYLGVLCEFSRYNVLQDFSTNANFLRVLTSHEYGHNLNSGHDASGAGTIMAPAVNNTTTWSAASIAAINNEVTAKINNGCLQTCGPPIPPTALFFPNYSLICEGSLVTMIDQSINSPTSWDWSFPGGTPTSSSEQYPTVTYPNSGTYTASLTVSNPNGSNSSNQLIIVGAGGTDLFHSANFENGTSGWAIENPNNNVTWTIGTVNSSRYGDGVMWIDNYSTNGLTGQRDALISPTLDFAGRNTINLEIEYAYARYNTTLRDSLVVYISTNDGLSYTRVFADTENGGGNFATHPDDMGNWTPAAESDWCFATTFGPDCLNIDISGFAGTSTAKVKIENVNGYGNNMFIDNVKLTSDCALNLPPLAFFSSDVQFGCAPLGVQFFDESINSPTSWDWTFPGGSPSSSTDQNPIIFYTESGVHEVSLTVSNPVGSNTFSVPAFINIDDVPEAGFTSIADDLTVDFTSTSTGNIVSYFWEFGDGNTSNLPNPTHTYDEDGVYEVFLTVSNSCGFTVMSEFVLVVSLPIAGFSADQTGGCVPFTVEFIDNSSSNVSDWNWSFPGGSPSASTEQNPTVVYNTPGVFDVTLEVTNPSGTDIAFFPAYISVDDAPEASFISTINDNLGIFSNNSINANSYFWTFGDGNESTDVNPVHEYDEDGTYTVTLEATNDCGTSTSTQTITISTAPNFAAFTANITAGCAPFTVDFTDLSPENVTSWNWTFTGGTPVNSNLQDPTVTYDSFGTYNVSLTVANSQGQASTTELSYILVDDMPEASFLSTVNNLTVSFSNNTTNANSYAWDFGDGNESTQSNPTHTYDMDGNYVVILSAFNDCGTTVVTESVSISTLPSAGFSANTTSGCVPMTVQFSDESSENTTEWFWTFAGGTPGSSTAQNPIVTYSQSGAFDVTLTVSNSTGDNSTSQTSYIIVDDVPTSDFSKIINEFTADFTNLSANANSYEWNFGDGNESTETDPSHTYEMDGTYFVTLTAFNDCGPNSFTSRITISTLPTAAFSVNSATGCAPFTVQFINESSENTDNVNWFFPGGEPSFSTELNPTVIYNTPGAYDVTLIASNSSGEISVSETSYINVLDIPTAEFLSTVNGAAVNFSNNSVGASTSFWDFGDEEMSADANPNHTYAMDGIYTVTLTSENQCGITSTVQEVTIITPPTAGFTIPTTVACLPFTIQLADNSSLNATDWNWTFDGGNPATSSAQNPTVTYNTAGTYSIILEVSNAAGSNTFTQTDVIVVNDVPSPNFSTVINNFNADFTNTSTGATSQTWNFGDNTFSNEPDPSHEYDMDGVYTVVLTTTNDCGTTTVNQEVTIITPPSPGFTNSVSEGCAPLTVQFSDNSSENTTGWSWIFEGGTPATSTEQNPTVVYENMGIYEVSLIVSNAAGQGTLVQSDLINVNDVPDANFSSVVDASTVNFTNSSSNYTSFQWDFGDENMSPDSNPAHTYANDGIYNVVLTMINDCGTVEVSEEITIATPPTAGFSNTTNVGCAPFEVQFTNESSSNSANFEWIFEGGNPASSTEENPIVIYETAGTFDVTLTVSNDNGESLAIQTELIIVNDIPETNFGFSTNGLNASFINDTNNATTYLWDFGDDTTSDEENPLHFYTEDGVYFVNLTASNECGETTTTEIVVIATSAPIAAFTSNQQIGCAPFTVQYENLSSANTAELLWTFPGGEPATSTEQNPIITYNNSGLYNATLQAMNPLGTNVSEIENYIEIIPEVVANFDFNPNIFIVDFINNSQHANSYLWDFGDDTTSDEENPTHEFTEPGTYLVTLTVENECGEKTFSQEVEILYTTPNAAFNADIQQGCTPFTINFEDISTGNPIEWLWTFEGGEPMTSTEQNPTIIYNSVGTFDVSLAVTNPAGNNMVAQISYIVIDAAPAPNFEFEATELSVDFMNTSTNGNSYMWDFGDDLISEEENPTHIYEDPGTYIIILTVTNDCGSVEIEQTVTVMPNGVEDIPGINAFNLFPNPNKGQFTLTLQGSPIDHLEYRFYNVIGQLLASEVLDFGNGNLVKHFDFNDVAKGVYIFELSAGDKALYKKVVIE